MNETGNSSDEYRDITESVQQIVKNNLNIQQEVHRITVEALTHGNLETERIRQVIQAVIEGVQSEMHEDTRNLENRFEQTVSGLDEALASAAIATKLAIQEASSRLGEFTEQEVKKSLEHLGDLEKQFLGTLSALAESSTDQSKEILSRFTDHAMQSGTAVGARSEEAISELGTQLQQFGKISLTAGNDFARATGTGILQIASGFLSGVADTLEKVDLTQKSNN